MGANGYFQIVFYFVVLLLLAKPLGIYMADVYEGRSAVLRFGGAFERLIYRVAGNAGKVITHRQLLRDVWGPSHVEHAHYLRIYMAQLRHKLEDDPARPAHLLTETGVGYRLSNE